MMKPTRIFIYSGALYLGAALPFLGLSGCASMERSVETPRAGIARSVDTTAAQAAELSGRIDSAARALDDLANHPTQNLRGQFDRYRDALDELRDAHRDLHNDVKEMETQGREYLVKWDREIATISDERLRNSAAERRTDVAANIEALHDRWIAAREAIAPLINRFEEIETVLRMDLTTSGIGSIRGSVDDAINPKDARAALKELSEAFRRASVSLAAATTPAMGDN